MYPRAKAIILVAALCAPIAASQVEYSGSGEEALEHFLTERGLNDVLAAHLRTRLKDAKPADRTALAERLGRIYVQMLATTADSVRRQALEAHARELVRTLPDEADVFDLRLDMAKATYLQAEELAERKRLRLATDEQVAEAQRILRTVESIFDDISNRSANRVRQLERREQNAPQAEAQQVQDQLAEARRIRSMARYYSGWCKYYQAMLGGQDKLSQQALVDFGSILNAAADRPPTIDRVPQGLLRYEHVARAAVGVALCYSLRGNDAEAIKWIDLVERAEGLPDHVQHQLTVRRLAVLASARRWSDVEIILARLRKPSDDTEPKPLETPIARYVAVLTLESLQTADTTQRRAMTLTLAIAQSALADLVARGEVGHVLDLVNRYGTAPIGDTGFIVQYVRGLQAFDRAREAHKATGADPDEPIKQDDVVNRYRDAAEVLKAAVSATDAEKFPADRARAAMRHGLSLFFASDFEAAAAAFENAVTLAGPPPKAGAPADAAKEADRREAMWFAIVALDHAVDGGKLSLVEPRDRLANLYIATYPRSEQAARLLLRRMGKNVSDLQAVDLLLAVEKESPLYPTARREAARRLYQLYIRASMADRDFAALRFAQVAEEVLDMDMNEPDQGAARPTLEQLSAVILRARQLALVMTETTAPDAARAERALNAIDTIVAKHSLDTAPFRDEVSFRRFRVALMRGDTAAVQKHLDQLRAAGGPFALAADRLLYNQAVNEFRANARSSDAARRVVIHGSRVFDQLAADEKNWKGSSLPAVAAVVAEAAFLLWSDDGDRQSRDLSLRLDKALFDRLMHTKESLRRLVRTAESAADSATALDAARALVAGLTAGTPEWFEARYESLRLLTEVDPKAAREVMNQHLVLYPDFGPPPYAEKLKELQKKIMAKQPG